MHMWSDVSSIVLQEVRISILDPLQSCAHQSGVTDNDVIKMYAQVHNTNVGTFKKLSLYSTTSMRDSKNFEEDMKTAAHEQKPLVLAVQKKARIGRY